MLKYDNVLNEMKIEIPPRISTAILAHSCHNSGHRTCCKMDVLFCYLCETKQEKENEGKNTSYFRCQLQSKVEYLFLWTSECELILFHVGFMVEKVALKEVPPPSTEVTPYQYHSTIAP
jgi:hypothetical protein